MSSLGWLVSKCQDANLPVPVSDQWVFVNVGQNLMILIVKTLHLVSSCLIKVSESSPSAYRDPMCGVYIPRELYRWFSTKQSFDVWNSKKKECE
jgi:hypothetical protein